MRRQSPSTAAVFLDRDGTLIEDRGHLRNPAEVVLFPETIPALLLLKDFFRLFIVTHQPGIAKGILSREEVEGVHRHLVDVLDQQGIPITAVYYCPHQREEQCACIKPNAFFLEKAARDYGILLGKSYVIGDHPHDVELAERVGAVGLYVLTGHGMKHRHELRVSCVVVSGILEAAQWIVRDHSRRFRTPITS